MEIKKYIGSNSDYSHEKQQINRIEDIIINWSRKQELPFVYFFENVMYCHEGLREGNNQGWNGEADLIAASTHHFIIFELKSKKGIVKGKTKKGLWKIDYENGKSEKKDFFCNVLK